MNRSKARQEGPGENLPKNNLGGVGAEPPGETHRRISSMKITNISVTVVDHGQPGRIPRIIPAGTPRRLRYTNEWQPTKRTGFESHELFLRVQTDEGVEGVCTCSSPELTTRQVEILKAAVIGLDPLRREDIYQRLHLGTRWVYQPPG